MNSNRYILVILRILMTNGLWFLKILSTAFLWVMFVYSNLNTDFLFFFFFYSTTFFSFSSQAIYFQTAKRIVFNEWLKISRKTSARLKSGVPRYWSSKIFYFKSVRDGWMKFLEWVDVENKLNLKKFSVPQWGSFPNGPLKNSKFSSF